MSHDRSDDQSDESSDRPSASLEIGAGIPHRDELGERATSRDETTRGVTASPCRRLPRLLLAAACVVVAVALVVPRLQERASEAGPHEAAKTFLEALLAGDLETGRQLSRSPETLATSTVTNAATSTVTNAVTSAPQIVRPDATGQPAPKSLDLRPLPHVAAFVSHVESEGETALVRGRLGHGEQQVPVQLQLRRLRVDGELQPRWFVTALNIERPAAEVQPPTFEALRTIEGVSVDAF